MSTKTRLSAIALSALIGVSGAIGAAGASASVADDVSQGTRVTWCTYGSVNARSGPGTGYSVIKTYRAGRVLTVVDTAYGWSDQLEDAVLWYKVASGGWVRADLLDIC